jgi:hypothetical protein
MAHWFGGKDDSIEQLIAKKKYAAAIELLRAQFQQGSRDPRLRLQLADVLVMAGKGREAVPVLIGLADELAREGFGAKAIAIYKKIERIEPGRSDVEKKLAALIQRERTATASIRIQPMSQALPEIGMEAMEPNAISPAPPPRAPAPAPPPSPEPEGVPVEPMSEEDFSLELTEVVQEAMAAGPPSVTAGPVVASPLFSAFSEDELMAVMKGMRLLTCEPGDIIVTEGEPGDSLFVLTTGVVKVFIRKSGGRHEFVREMGEGTFFGEISILEGGARTATVTAASRCELLELDRATLLDICSRHPNTQEVLRQFYRERQARGTRG